ncbi:response regulator [Methanobrevibacter arboriphilus]|uniref:hypothetical protein n=1 Tax=Methanobrevibacter arboriphilus TaxID=39441 RepID=UPI000AA65F92|nr:hypothetical protein [Methanobrevibacter arboriphilus]
MSKNILIVEDNKYTGIDLKNKLESLNYKVIDIVPTEEEGINIAIEKKTRFSFNRSCFKRK